MFIFNALQEKQKKMMNKESLRTAWLDTLAENSTVMQWGKVAQKLRGLPLYREAATVFATPGKSLHQARINCLVDGKNLVMPGSSIRTGFFLLPARSISFKDIPAAVTYKGLAEKGQLLKGSAIAKLSVGLLLTDSMAVDRNGGRIGDGNGFFDLCCALLQEFRGLREEWEALTIIDENHISQELLPQDAWDIKLAGAVTQSDIHTFAKPEQKPRIYWDALSRDRIKRIDPLWKLYSAKQKS